MQRKILIKFLSEWQVSSGIGDGYLAITRFLEIVMAFHIFQEELLKVR